MSEEIDGDLLFNKITVMEKYILDDVLRFEENIRLKIIALEGEIKRLRGLDTDFFANRRIANRKLNLKTDLMSSVFSYTRDITSIMEELRKEGEG